MRGRTWLPDCIAALRAQIFRDFEIIVVDNASKDGSREWLAAQPDVRVIRNETNIGFATACNQGVRASEAPFIALLNDDTRAEPQWLEALVEAMTQDTRCQMPDARRQTTDPQSGIENSLDPRSDSRNEERDRGRKSKIGSAASLMLFADRPALVQSAGVAVDRAAIAWDRLRGYPAHSPEAMRACEVFGPSAGAALYRRAMLDDIGLFDERFFAYLEDVDLAWRAQRAGWRCVYVPQARVLHHTSATSVEGSSFKHRLLGRNKVWLVAKNARLRDAPIIVFYDLAAIMYAGLARGEWSHLAGRWEGLRGLRQFMQVRRAIASQPVRLDPLVAPWRVPQRMMASPDDLVIG